MAAQNISIIRACLLASREDFGGYITYVFKNLNTGKLEMCVRLPNWNTPHVNQGDCGWLKTKLVIGGQTPYYSINNQKQEIYKYSQIYFEDFILDKPEQNKIIL